MLSHGLNSCWAYSWPAWKADSYTRFFEAVGEGRTSAVTGDFAALMGREPRGVEEFVAAGLS